MRRVRSRHPGDLSIRQVCRRLERFSNYPKQEGAPHNKLEPRSTPNHNSHSPTQWLAQWKDYQSLRSSTLLRLVQHSFEKINIFPIARLDSIDIDLTRDDQAGDWENPNTMANETYNAPAAGIPFFTPKHAISPGTPLDPKAKVPTLFTPLQVRGATLRNRIIVAPMCQYSTSEAGPQIGALTPYHITTLGHYGINLG